MPFGQRPSLLGGASLDPGEVAPTPTGVIPTANAGPVVDASTLGSNPEEGSDPPFDQLLDSLAEGASTLVAQADEPTSPDSPRGTPVPSESTEGINISRELHDNGEARVRALSEMFGQDALVLGHLLFKIPPLAIRVKKGNITYRWKPLRTKESIAVKSGNGECYIEVDLAFVGLNQIQNSLSELIALWKKVPFCFIENVHIRNMMIPKQFGESMAVCLESLVLDAVSGRPNTVYATLIMKWFNYKPFSRNFWFRSEWTPAEGARPQQQNTGDGGPESSNGQETTQEGGESSPTNNPAQEGLIDLSVLQDSSALSSFVSDLPLEVGMQEQRQASNPGDANMAPTYPVVYPFNSQPFLDRVRSGEDSAVRITSWGDSVQMNYNSFIRMKVPRSWSYSLDRSAEVSVAAGPARPTRQRTLPGQQRGNVPAPVTGDRDTVIFIGDSIMVGFTSQVNKNNTNAGDSGIPFFEWPSNARFPDTEGFTYYGMMRVGARSRTMLSWWNSKKDDAVWKAEGNSASCSRIAGVLIHAGTNDGANGPDIDNLSTIVNEVSGYGAIPMVCRLPPSNHADHLTPPKFGQLRLSLGGEAAFQAYQNNLATYNSELKNMVEGSGGVFIDHLSVLVEPTFINSPSPPLAEQFHGNVPGQPTYYNIHWNSAGYTAGGNQIHGLMPWNSLRGIATPNEEPQTWTVCGIQDGDTIWVWGTSQQTNQRTMREVRLQYIDTPESYTLFEDTQYNNGGANPLIQGQDSYRPPEAQYATIAKNALAQKLPDGTSVEIDFNGTGAYGRWLGVVKKNGEDINEFMIKEGHAWADVPRDPDTGRSEQETTLKYWIAEMTAQGRWPEDRPASNGPRGIWLAQEETLQGLPSNFSQTVADSISRLMKPSDFRGLYPPDSNGGFEGPPADCGGSGNEPLRKYIIVNGERINTTFDVNHNLQFVVGSDNLQSRPASQCTGGILHYTAGEGNGQTAYDTLKARGLSAHFSLDRDGTLFQYCDPATTISHTARTSENNVAWSIEVTAYGVASRRRVPSRAQDRPTYDATVHGTEYTFGDFYPIQDSTLFELCDLIHNALNLSKVALVGPNERVTPDSTLANSGTVRGHYHSSDTKIDPGPRVLQRLSQRPGWSSQSL